MSFFVVSPSVVGQFATSCWHTSLRHSRIGWRTITRDAVIAASSEAEGWPAAAVANAMTYERWRPMEVPAWIRFDAGASPEGVDYLGIAAHTLGSAGARVTLESSIDGSAWAKVAEVDPTDDSPIMVLFERAQVPHWRLSVDGAVASVGVVHLGAILETYRPVSAGHTPGVLARVTETLPNKSEGGQFLGRSVVRQGYATSFSWEHLPADWYRQQFDPFVESARAYPFFIAWNPGKYPDEVMYGWTNDDIKPEYMGIRDWMQVTVKVEGVA